jgi:polar amino acid transport system substrate-binding protein
MLTKGGKMFYGNIIGRPKEMVKPVLIRSVIVFLVAVFCLGAGIAEAGPLMDRIEAGKTIRLGFANEIPWAYPGEGNKPLGFANAITIGALKEMGYENLEPVVTDWGGLIPGLKANRFDVITGGMYILNSRCQNVSFSEPIGIFGDAFIVAKGNPKGLENYQDVKEKGAVFVTGAGFNTVEAAKAEGVPDSKIMQVPGMSEILAAVRSGRADAGGLTYFSALNLAKEAKGAIEVTNPSALPEKYLNWVGIGFRKEDPDFLKKFNAALASYLGSNKMLKDVKEYGYTKDQLPGDMKTEWVCTNR